jgi:hypothetical protein
VSVESHTERGTPPSVHGEHEPELPHSPLPAQSCMATVPQGPRWQADTPDGAAEGAIARQQTDPPSQSALDVHPSVTQGASAPHACASDGAAS